MSFTNQTPNFGLPQWIGTDKPTFLGDLNGAFSDIDTALKNNADASAAATATANSANATATSANTNATTALGTANSAASDAASAVTTAQSADTKATQALSAASGAETAAAANTIENLAPAYDNTLTYDVGDLVTFVDAQGHGRLYKCVVAVNSPMDFNINYWDDVTTSEVFARKEKLVATYTNTIVGAFYGAVLDALASQLVNIGEVSRMVVTAANGTVYHYEANNYYAGNTPTHTFVKTHLARLSNPDRTNLNTTEFFITSNNSSAVEMNVVLDDSPSTLYANKTNLTDEVFETNRRIDIYAYE